MMNVTVFLSAVSAEFRSYREAIRHHLDRQNVSVKVQEDFFATGTLTLDKLDEYIRHCDVVVHLVGDMTGAMAQSTSVAAIGERYGDFVERVPALTEFLMPGAPTISYTQWEAWLAVYHRKVLLIAVPTNDAARDETYKKINEQRTAQLVHLARLETAGRYKEIDFANADELALKLATSTLLDILVKAELALQQKVGAPSALPAVPVHFTGRDAEMEQITALLHPAPEHVARVVIKAGIEGMGGMGKTALAVAVAHAIKTEFPGGQLFFELGANSPAPMSGMVARRRWLQRSQPDAKLPEDEANLSALYRERLAGGPVLVIVDDPSDPNDVRALEPPPGGAMLITSRRALSGHRAITLHALTLPAAQELLGSLCERLIGSPHCAQLAELCARLPIALQAAGRYLARRRSNPVEEYLRELTNSRLQLLSQASADDPGLNVEIVLAYSLQGLNEPEREAMQALSVIAGDFDRTFGTRVAGCEGRLIDSLVEFGLLSFNEQTQRAAMHDLMRELIARGTPAHSSKAARLRYAEAAKDALAQAHQLYISGGMGVGAGLASFDRERTHMEAAYAFLASSSEHDAALSDFVRRTASLFDLRQAPQTRIEWLEAAHAAAVRCGDKPREELDHLVNLGIAYYRLGLTQVPADPSVSAKRHFEQSVASYNMALRICRQLEPRDPDAEGSIVANFGNTHLAVGDTVAAWNCYLETLRLSHATHNRRNLGQAHHNLGRCHAKCGKWEQAIKRYRGHSPSLGNWATITVSEKGIAWRAWARPTLS
jgi:tetratricopeptide (TPR) repeat protein